MVKVQVKNKNLNNGTETEIFCNFNELEFRTQFEEIFSGEQYKGGRKKDAVVVDVGANIGLSVLYFKDSAKMIYAIEPNPTYYKFLELNTKDLKNVKTYNMGLGPYNAWSHLISQKGDDREERAESIWGEGTKKVPFLCKTLATFMKDVGIDHIDVLKVDCEGSEYPMFMSDSFKEIASKIDFIVGESHYFEALEPDFIPEALGEYGFKVKFLPFKNMFKVVSIQGPMGKLGKEYKIWKQTIFEAKR